MLGFSNKSSKSDGALRKALDKSRAIVEFDPSGRILDANEIFCRTLGYSREEIVGKHHSMFVEPTFAQGADYRAFWAQLGRGEYNTGEYKRIGKGGREIWVRASYNPVLDGRGAVERIIELARDVTVETPRSAEHEAKLAAISRAQAVIEFTPSGEVIDANENFLRTMGYSLGEIKGKHHRMFVDPAYAASPVYSANWDKVGRGEPLAGIFKRIGKGGKLVLLQASYNPIFDLNGKVTKVVKFANDLSDLDELGEGLKRLAAGDVEKPIERTFQATFEPIRLDFNEAQQKLKTAMLSISESTQTVAGSGKEVASASQNLSDRTEQQAASLEETAAALAAVTETVKRAASNSSRARTVVGEARGDAERGGDIVKRAVDAMGRIEKSSQQISQIIGVIDEIAFQTNLLALNAGVEAARAGDAGRGFAVVASEVRALAQRSADAAKEIKGLISASSTEVVDGVKLVGETGDSLGRIIDRVGEINGLITEIASGAEEQTNALLEVNTAVRLMDEATQQNAAMAEESNAASRSLLSEAEKLSDLIAQFRLGGGAKSIGGDVLRRELKRAAPHAFATRAAPPPSPANRQAPKRIAAVAKSSANNADWSEF